MYGKGLTRSWKTANYAYPRGAGPDRGKRPSYPIDPRHVRAALSYSARRNTSSSRATIERRLRQRYGSVANALAAARRASPSKRRAKSSRSRAVPRSRAGTGSHRRRVSRGRPRRSRR